MRQTEAQIQEVAKAFDDAIETRDLEQILPYFAEDCVIELLGVTLKGKDGARRWLEWVFQHLETITFEPIIIMIKGNTFFEEFVVKGKLANGKIVQSKQAEVLIYENLLVKELRIYFDRLDFAEAVATGFLSQRMVKHLIKQSIRGLI